MVLSDRLRIIGRYLGAVKRFAWFDSGAIRCIMPIYVYKCTQCNEYCEALQKSSDEPLKTCPHCQAEALIKVIAPVGVIFKGTGFHKNDYSGSKSNSSSKPSTSESKPAESAASSDSKPATSESKPSGGDTGGGGSDKVA
jgi:putative FmdB family regulatory protein